MQGSYGRITMPLTTAGFSFGLTLTSAYSLTNAGSVRDVCISDSWPFCPVQETLCIYSFTEVRLDSFGMLFRISGLSSIFFHVHLCNVLVEISSTDLLFFLIEGRSPTLN
jgi:hypothetical protein